MSSAWDLAVVGAGPAGTALAIAAARSGLSVVVVDTAHFPRQKVCGEYLAPEGWRLLDELGLPDLRAQSVPLPTMRVAADERTSVTMTFDGDVPQALSRFALDARLVEEAGRAGAMVLTDRRVRRVVVEHGRAVGLECAGEGEHHSSELSEFIRARLIVGADGRRSVVVRDTGRMNRRDLGLLGFKRHVRPAGGKPAAEIAMHALSGGYFGTCPTEDAALNVCGVIPVRLVKATRGDVGAALARWTSPHPTLSHYVSAEGDKHWHSMPDVSPQWAQPVAAGVLYVGDAQGTIEPLAGQGMTMALASARLAHEWIRRHGVEGFDAATQAAYVAHWRMQFAAPIRAAAWSGRLLRNPTLLKTLIVASRPARRLADRLLRRIHGMTLTAAVA